MRNAGRRARNDIVTAKVMAMMARPTAMMMAAAIVEMVVADVDDCRSKESNGRNNPR